MNTFVFSPEHYYNMYPLVNGLARFDLCNLNNILIIKKISKENSCLLIKLRIICPPFVYIVLDLIIRLYECNKTITRFFCGTQMMGFRSKFVLLFFFIHWLFKWCDYFKPSNMICL